MRLARLEPGARLRASRIAGDFALPQDRSTPLLLIAGGVGITPFLAQLPEIACRDAVLVHAVRDAGDLAYVAELAAAGVRTVVVSPAPCQRCRRTGRPCRVAWTPMCCETPCRT